MSKISISTIGELALVLSAFIVTVSAAILVFLKITFSNALTDVSIGALTSLSGALWSLYYNLEKTKLTLVSKKTRRK